MDERSIETRINESILPEERKQHLRAMIRGEILTDVYYDVVAKHVFSPDLYPERMEFILRHTMKEKDIIIDHSAANEAYLQNIYSKKTISDLPAWLKDNRLVDLGIQWEAQEYIFNRADIYGSNMLLLQYSAEEGQKKSEVDFENVKGVIVIVLMVKSPKIFKEFRSDRYIHRFAKVQADSGLKFEMLKQMVFVQLDKALEVFLNGNYNKDEDIELLKMFSLIADINNEKVKRETEGEELFDGIREDVYQFTQSKEVQQMILAEDLDIMMHNSQLRWERREGQKEERKDIGDLNIWLLDQKRVDDVRKAAEDSEYMDVLFEEYRKTIEEKQNS